MIAKEIKSLRKKLGLTQKEFAARVNVDAITVSRWERGQQHPSNLALRQLARLVRCSQKNNQETGFKKSHEQN